MTFLFNRTQRAPKKRLADDKDRVGIIKDDVAITHHDDLRLISDVVRPPVPVELRDFAPIVSMSFSFSAYSIWPA